MLGTTMMMNAAKRFASAAILAGSLAAGSLYAQSSQSMTATATVATPITGGSSATLAFGTVTKGQANSITPTGANAGALYFSGDESDNVTIAIPASVVLSTNGGNGSSTMMVSLNRAAMKANRKNNLQANAVNADASSGSVTVALSADAAGDGTDADGLGQLYLWIGGSVTPSATQQRGDYSGTFTVSASYSN